MSFDKALESLKTVNLRGGIFGKTALLLIVLSICVAAVCIKTDIWWLQIGLMLPLMGIVLYALKRVLDFAERNPQAAIMDGAELLVHERIVHARKGVEMLPPVDPVIDHQLPPIAEAEIRREDPTPQPAIGAGRTPSIQEGGE
jgi:hypothetical protein